jgi:hypothetical protein
MGIFNDVQNLSKTILSVRQAVSNSWWAQCGKYERLHDLNYTIHTGGTKLIVNFLEQEASLSEIASVKAFKKKITNLKHGFEK